MFGDDLSEDSFEIQKRKDDSSEESKKDEPDDSDKESENLDFVMPGDKRGLTELEYDEDDDNDYF